MAAGTEATPAAGVTDALATALATPGLAWITAAVFLAGLVRGFTGFGTALVYLPIAAQFWPPEQAIAVMAIFDIFGPMAIAPRALKDADIPDLRRLLIGVVVGLPLGLSVLFVISEEVFRWSVSLLALAMLLGLLTGWRYGGRLTPPLVYGTGAAGGFCGGAAGIPGPPVIFLYLASHLPAASVRANTTLYLLGYDILLLIGLFWAASFGTEILFLGLLLAIPNALGNLVGATLFRPGYETLYRTAAYLIILASALSGLPIWS